MKKSALIRGVMDAVGIQFGDRTVTNHLTQVFASVVGQLFNTNPGNYHYYTKRITLNVLNREAELPVPLLQTAVAGRGIPRMTLTDGATPLWPVSPVFLDSTSDVFGLHNTIGYAVYQDRVRFTRRMPVDDMQVYADAVVEFSVYGDDDEISLPAGVAQIIIDNTVAAVKGDATLQNIYKKS